ncbi:MULTISPECIES: TetR family transcriptional regulator [unclassified Enterococcus]|uniref:TetR family transcriptional regulator n=1 Tax=unclassified Enterococcus TaxID=2608891 RepID=UPI0006B934A6|nr:MULTISPECIES: TetR family transcriptional regulator [unclassified Enterococcus]KPG70511.1 TetR family transcriptional regulator [Enterococcus sp. RIT-PI-f]
MPTETFFHLPAEKQKRIMNAAKKEFSRLPLKDASIATIIKDAEIPRGSFYQYFENKEDLYYYYFHTLKSDSQRDLIRSIQHEKGDLFAGFEWYFSRMIEEVLKGKNANFYRNLFLSMDYRSFHKVMPEIHKKMHHAHHEERKATRKKEEAEFFAEIDKDLLKVADDHELKLLIQLLMHTVFSTITEAYRHIQADDSYDPSLAMSDFNSKIRWLREGAKKERGETHD